MPPAVGSVAAIAAGVEWVNPLFHLGETLGFKLPIGT